MSVLLLRLAGPMQSWGVQSRFSVRDTGLEPSKSGVVGLLCAALGRKRDAPVDDLAALTMGVRVDVEGVMAYDYHTALNVLTASGGLKECEPSTRYYLADAKFLVGLEGDDLALLARLHEALRRPHWPLYLGRKAFVPGEPVWLEDGLRPAEDLAYVLSAYPWLGTDPQRWQELQKRGQRALRTVIEDLNGTEVRPDQPVSFAERRFMPRRVRTEFIPVPPWKEDVCTSPA